MFLIIFPLRSMKVEILLVKNWSFFFNTKREGRERPHRRLDSKLPQEIFLVWQEAALEGSKLALNRPSVWQEA